MRLKTILCGGACAFIGMSVVSFAHAADVKNQKWRDTNLRPEIRAEALLKAMTVDQKITLVNSVDPAEYAPLATLGIPALARVDASSGLRGDRGVTAFPVPLALGASFDARLAREYGKAIAVEARKKGWNLILGPTVDLARDGLSGRLPESFGEDPVVNGVLGAEVTKGMQQQKVLAMAKHYTAYTTERDRLKLNVVVGERALNEVYNIPFNYLIERAQVASIMGSYSKVNGTYVVENPNLVSLIKNQGFKGYMTTDFLAGSDAVAQFNAGIDSWSFQPYMRQPAAFKDGRISEQRLDDAVRRTLWALFFTGVFDHPVTNSPAAIVSTPEHQALALQVAESATVLLKNEGDILPLKPGGHIAVIGPAGKDVITGVMWSSYVDPGQFMTPIEAIAAAAGNKAKVIHAQGSSGDTVLPTLRLAEGMFDERANLTTPDGKPGWQVKYYGTPDFSGQLLREDIVKSIDVSGKPWTTISDQWSAVWTARLTPDSAGLVRFATHLSGTVKVKVDGKIVIDGMRSTSSSFPGGGDRPYPLQGLVELAAGRPVSIEVEYSTKGAWLPPRIQLGWQSRSLIPQAVQAARNAAVAIVFVNQVTGEEMDRDNYDLPADQNALIDAVSAANPNTVVVLNTGGAVKMPWLPKVKAVLQMWYPGSATGTGIANVLFGRADPGGRLPVSFPKDENQGPRPYKAGSEVHYLEGVNVGYAYLQKHQQKALFPFGHGLSYTTASLSQLQVEPLKAGSSSATVSVRVKNTGKRAGVSVVQVYAGSLPTSVETPVSKLVGFGKVHLRPGEQKNLRIPVERRLLSYWDETADKWITPPGSVRLSVGFSSDNILASDNMEVDLEKR